LNRSTRFFANFIAPSDLVFDIGANFGARTESFLRIGAVVCAVEPQAECIAELKATFGGNPGFRLLAKAVGSAPGTAKMYVSNQSTLVATLSSSFRDGLPSQPRHSSFSYEQAIEVECTTLDEMISQFGIPVFCKIDTEGFEDEVLRGLSQPIPMLSFEYLPWLLNVGLSCMDRLHALDAHYAFNACIGETFTWDSDRWLCFEEMQVRLPSIASSNPHQYGDVYAKLM
jgi:FkbM family methyltransferase